MKNDGEEKILTPEDIVQEYKLLQKELDAAVKTAQHEEASKKIWRILAFGKTESLGQNRQGHRFCNFIRVSSMLICG